MTRRSETKRRTADILAWLEANPQGGSARDIHAGVQHGRSFSTTQKLLIMMALDAEPMVLLGGGTYTRYAATKHKESAQAHIDAVIAARATRWSRKVAADREREQQLLAAGDNEWHDEKMVQRVVSEWERPQVKAARSVFEWAGK